jgi:hypothetical protein
MEPMTPAAAINHVLDSVDGLVVDAGNDETVTALLAAATAIAGIALMRVGDAGERGALLLGIERGVRNYIDKVMALQAKRPTLPKVSSNGKGGNGAGGEWPHVIGRDGTR